MEFSIGISIGIIVGIVLGAIGTYWILKTQQKQQDASALNLTEQFQKISDTLVQKNAQSFLELAKEKLQSQSQVQSQVQNKELDNKKNLIDQSLSQIKKEMEKVQQTITTIEKDREQKFGQLGQYLKMTNMNTQELTRTTTQLKEALASSKARGQWGERMAEDVLRLSGLVEGINYVKQTAMEGSRRIPDFTFFLPNQHTLNMDVKFPLSHYLKYLDAQTDSEKQEYQKEFLRDVKLRIKEVSSRDYINPENNTVDYVLIFIPNEQVYTFIQELDLNLINEALAQKVIFCSPLTLYALLAVIRQAIDNFAMSQKTGEIMEHISNFYKQWGKYSETIDKMGRSIDTVNKDFENLVTTRSNQLEKPLKKIEELRQDQGNIQIEMEAS